MKKITTSIILVIVFFVFQTTIIKNISLGGISPNIIILLPVSWGFFFGKREGLIIGFFVGLMTDLFCGIESILGIYAFFYMIIGYLNGIARDYLSQKNKKIPYALLLGSDLILSLVTYVVFFLIRNRFDFSWYLGNIIIPELIYTLFLSFFIIPPLEKISVYCVETKRGVF